MAREVGARKVFCTGGTTRTSARTICAVPAFVNEKVRHEARDEG
jgi:hypothetical protein